MSLQESPVTAVRFNQYTTKWNEKCDTRLKELWLRADLNIDQIGALLSIELGGSWGYHAISYRAHNLRLPIRQHPSQWTPEVEDRFRQLHTTGKSFSEISKTLNEEFPGLRTTRNGCIGKGRRLGLELRQARVNHSGLTKKRAPRGNPGIGILRSISQRAATGTRALPKQPILQIPFLGLDLMKLESGQCRYPHGGEGGEPILFCGGPSEEGQPYCAGHCAIAYRPHDIRMQKKWQNGLHWYSR